MATKKTTTTRKVYYRRCQFQPSTTQTLQQALSAALADKQLIDDRLEATDATATGFRVINQQQKKGATLCGMLLTFDRGGYQLVIEDRPSAARLAMTAMHPPKINGTQHQFVPGVLFFAVFENHVAVIQAAGLRASAFEQHLAWLIRDQCKLMARDAGLALVDEPRKATKERIRKSHVKALSVGRPFMNEAEHTPQDAGFKISKKQDVTKLEPDPGILTIIKEFMGEDRYSKLDIEGAVFDGNLEVWLEIRYPKRTRVNPSDTTKLMDNLAIALRDQEENSVALELADGTTVKGEDLKISSTITVSMQDGVPDMDALYADMTDWLAGLIRNKMVAA